jgi:predicted solute-binding protein
MLKQLYYNHIYPYLTYGYGVMSWGNTYSTNLTKIRTKQNKCIRSIASRKESACNYYR